MNDETAIDLSPIISAFAWVGVFILLLAIVAWVLSTFRGKGEIFPYATQPMLTPTEALFLQALRPAVPPTLWLLSKVRLADFLRVTIRGDQYLSHFGRISQKHADFLLVDPASGAPVLVIELDDSTHRHNARTMASDDFKDRAFEAANLPVLRIPTARSYDSREIAQSIERSIGQR